VGLISEKGPQMCVSITEMLEMRVCPGHQPFLPFLGTMHTGSYDHLNNPGFNEKADTLPTKVYLTS